MAQATRELTPEQIARRKDFATYLQQHLTKTIDRFSYMVFFSRYQEETIWSDSLQRLASDTGTEECGTVGCIAGHYCSKYFSEFQKECPTTLALLHRGAAVTYNLFVNVQHQMQLDLGLTRDEVDWLTVPASYQRVPMPGTRDHTLITRAIIERIVSFLEGNEDALYHTWVEDLCLEHGILI